MPEMCPSDTIARRCLTGSSSSDTNCSSMSAKTFDLGSLELLQKKKKSQNNSAWVILSFLVRFIVESYAKPFPCFVCGQRDTNTRQFKDARRFPKTPEDFQRRPKILRAISKTFYIFMKLARINRISIHWGSEEN